MASSTAAAVAANPPTVATVPTPPGLLPCTQGPGAGASASAPPTRTPRRYGFACVNCRKRKVRCDGARPYCHNCRRTQEECSYKKEPSDVQLRMAETRVAVLEEKLRALALSSNEDRERILKDHLRESPGSQQQHLHPLQLVSREGLPPSLEDDEEDDEELLAQVSIDEEGKVCYFGATSRFYLAPERRERSSTSTDGSMAMYEDKQDQDYFRSNSMLQKSWERLAYANLQHDYSIDPELSATLLQIYWTWQHPLHMCVYRPCFIRDMALGGPYFSQFLLNVIYAHASRHANDNDPRFVDVGRGERFLAKAKLLLSSEMEATRPKIPTIQGLLILGGRQCAIGKSSEGWLYTGMALRMMKDVGLHLNPRKLKGIESMDPDDLEARKRLFMSAYTWDKSISLCLGRPPSLTESIHRASDILDDSDDVEEWTPICLPEVEQVYPPTKSYATAAFRQFFQLSEIINEIYVVIYNQKRKTNWMQQVLEFERKLRNWHRSLPDFLRIDDVTGLGICPPPHIFSLNLLYHTVLIILFRPIMLCTEREGHDLVQKASKICAENTTIIHEFFLLYGRTFKFKLMTYLVSYCVYTAATINVHEIKSSDAKVSQAAAMRLSVSLKVLESEAQQTPGVRRSIDIIKRQLRSFSAYARRPHANGGMPPVSIEAQMFDTTTTAAATAVDAGPVHEPSPMSSTGELDFIDTGGGFQPNALNWTLQDTLMASPDFGEFSWAGEHAWAQAPPPQQHEGMHPRHY